MAPTDAFDDADELDPSAADVTDEDLCALLASMLRAELTGTREGAIESALDAAPASARSRMLLCLGDALRADDLVQWIEADARRRARAIAIVGAIVPPDPAAAHNAIAAAHARAFREWDRYDYPLIIVPGYTPLSTTTASRGVHPVAQARLVMASGDLAASKAPFVLVSGGNVYPRGTTIHEALEMRDALLALGVRPERILVDARARHTTTNLRNAGRMMRRLGMSKGLIVTMGGGVAGSTFFGQDFYLSHPTLSTFHSRCERELGYRVGELRGIDDARIELLPSPSVDQPSFRDPLDP